MCTVFRTCLKTFLLSSLILHSLSFRLNAREIRFGRIGEERGLAQKRITYIFQDSRGFVWFGTPDGLVRFDGRKAKVYGHDPETGAFIHHRHDPGDPQTLENDGATFVHIDSKGVPWVATETGLNRLDPETGIVRSYRPGPECTTWEWPYTALKAARSPATRRTKMFRAPCRTTKCSVSPKTQPAESGAYRLDSGGAR